jgi:hypothetical protein
MSEPRDNEIAEGVVIGALQISAVLSPDAVTMRVPSGLYAAV